MGWDQAKKYYAEKRLHEGGPHIERLNGEGTALRRDYTKRGLHGEGTIQKALHGKGTTRRRASYMEKQLVIRKGDYTEETI